MYIKENELIEIEIPKGRHLSSWQKKLNDSSLIGGQKIKIYWVLLIGTTHRTKCIDVLCDDCDVIFNRRIRDLDPKNNIHYCHSCRTKGNRNFHYGKPMNESFKIGRNKLFNERGNPFTWPETIEKIKNSPNFINKGLKIRGIKRSEETKKKMSDGIKHAYRIGKKKPRSEWSNIEIKKYKEVEYQGSYELKFLLFIESLGKLNLIERGPIIQYIYNGENHSYFSDFRIKDLNIVFEIKSDYYWKKKLDVNIAKRKAAESLYDYHLIINNNFTKVKNILDNI